MANSDNSDDSDNGEFQTNTASEGWFCEEVNSLLESSLKDFATFNSLIPELDQVRQSYSQEPIVLNRAVIRSLINLPFLVNCNIHGDLEKYSVTFNEVLERYDPLLRSLNKNRGSQLEGIEAVTLPVIELISLKKLNSTDWSTHKVQNFLNVLKNHQIVDSSKGKEIITTIVQTIENQQIIAPAVVPHSLPSTSSIATTTTATTTTLDMPVAVKGCEVIATTCPFYDDKAPIELCSDTFSTMVDHRGGKLTTYMTDDIVDVPQGAVPVGKKYKISGKVHTSLRAFRTYLEKDEKLIAPVNEFFVNDNHHFEKFVTITIRHAITDRNLFGRVKIILAEDDGNNITVLPESKRVEGQPWFCVDDAAITIHTLQFCKVICKLNCGKEHEVNGKFVGYLFAQVFKSGETFFTFMEYYLYFRETVQRLPAFEENLLTSFSKKGRELAGKEVFPVSPKELKLQDKILVELSLISNENNKWIRCDQSHELKQEYIFENFMECLEECQDPVAVAKYVLSSNQGTFLGKLEARMFPEHQNGAKYKIEMLINISYPFGIKSEQVTKSSLSDDKLWRISAKMKPDSWYPVGLELGLTSIELDQIETDNKLVVKQTFQMLRLWRDKLPRNVEQETRAIASLKTVLASFTNQEAVNLLSEGNNLDSSELKDMLK